MMFRSCFALIVKHDQIWQLILTVLFLYETVTRVIVHVKRENEKCSIFINVSVIIIFTIRTYYLWFEIHISFKSGNKNKLKFKL